MGNTALELSGMSDGEKDVAKTLYETYEKTKITGEGSRSGFQQMKDAWHILYDPTTWMGGKFLMGPAQKAATRKGIMLALSKGKDKAVLKSQPEKLAVARKLKEAESFLPKFYSQLMKVAKTGSINKKTASRKISKISKINFTVPSNDMLTIETMHLMICHLITTMLRNTGKPVFEY